MDSVVVTGASGFVGSHLVALLASSGVAVTGWRRTTEIPRQGQGEVRWRHVDLLDREAVRRSLADDTPAAIYHCAAVAHVGQSWKNIRETLETNALGTHHLLDALRREKLSPKVLIPGSSMVYRQSDRALHENDPTGPSSPYAVSKLAQEMIGLRGAHEDAQHVLLTRSFNHTGPGQDASYAASGFARQIAVIEAGGAKPVIAAGNLEASRDLHDVRDTVRAYRDIVERGRPGVLYNVCAGRAFRIRELLDRLASMSRVRVTVEIDPARYGRATTRWFWETRPAWSGRSAGAQRFQSSRRFPTCLITGERSYNRRKSESSMKAYPVLFDLSSRIPTTRQVALDVKEHGASLGLPDAAHPADGATYQEVTCRSALNRVEGMPFAWTLNPYRGCTHGCHYCFARRYHTQFELGTGDEFSSVILVKKNFVEVLRRELDRPSWKNENVAFGTATDPYQPIEGHYKLTRHALEALAASRTPFGLITKGPMVVRDADVLKACSARAACTVYVSVPSVDEDAWRMLEPGTAHPLQRLRAVRELSAAGIRAGVLMAPIVPGLTSQPAKLERTIKAIADHGASFVGANVLHLQEGTRDHFMTFLEKTFPELSRRYQKLYAGPYAPKAYTNEVRAIVKLLQERYGVRKRTEKETPGDVEPPGGPGQGTFEF